MVSNKFEEMSEEAKQKAMEDGDSIVTMGVLQKRATSDIDGLIVLMEKVKRRIAEGDFTLWKNFLTGRGEEILSMMYMRFGANEAAFEEGRSVTSVIQQLMKESDDEKS